MMTMVRDRGYPELLSALRGRRVLLWTCDTCARMCGVGGIQEAEALSARLSADGIDVAGAVSSPACCLMSRSRAMAEGAGDCDLVLALCCSAGARNAAEAAGREVLNPVETIGPGYLDDDGRPRVLFLMGEGVPGEPLDDVAGRRGLPLGPYRASARVYMAPRLPLYRSLR